MFYVNKHGKIILKNPNSCHKPTTSNVLSHSDSNMKHQGRKMDNMVIKSNEKKEDSLISNLDYNDIVEVTIFFHFDCCPYQNKWEIWTPKDEYFGNNSEKGSQTNAIVILDSSNAYLSAEPYTSIEEVVRLNKRNRNGSPMSVTMTVYDSGHDGFVQEDSRATSLTSITLNTTNHYFYQVNRTDYYDYHSINKSHNELIEKGEDELDERWTQHETIIATVNGSFYKNNHLLLPSPLSKTTYSNIIKTSSSKFKFINTGTGNDKDNPYSTQSTTSNDNSHHHHNIAIHMVLFIGLLFVGINCFIGIAMYRTRQRGTCIKASQDDSCNFDIENRISGGCHANGEQMVLIKVPQSPRQPFKSAKRKLSFSWRLIDIEDSDVANQEEGKGKDFQLKNISLESNTNKQQQQEGNMAHLVNAFNEFDNVMIMDGTCSLEKQKAQYNIVNDCLNVPNVITIE